MGSNLKVSEQSYFRKLDLAGEIGETWVGTVWAEELSGDPEAQTCLLLPDPCPSLVRSL